MKKTDANFSKKNSEKKKQELNIGVRFPDEYMS